MPNCITLGSRVWILWWVVAVNPRLELLLAYDVFCNADVIASCRLAQAMACTGCNGLIQFSICHRLDMSEITKTS